MNTQDILTHFIIDLTLFCFSLMLIDLIGGLIYLWHQVKLDLQSLVINTANATSNPESSNLGQSINIESESENQENNHISSVSENLLGIDVNKIDLRTARKIATAIKKFSKSNLDLTIKQKINGQNVNLALLQAQIKNQFELVPEIVTPIIREFAPTALTMYQQDIQIPNCVKASKHKAS